MKTSTLRKLSAGVLLLAAAQVNAALITNVTVEDCPDGYNVYGDGTHPEYDYEPAKCINGDGLTDNVIPGQPPTHNNYTWGSSWINKTDTFNYITFDLGAEYTLDALRIWNLNAWTYQPGDQGWMYWGTNTFKLEAATAAAPTTFTTISETITLARAPGTLDYTGQLFDGYNFSARYIKFSNITKITPGDTAHGLSEIQFYGAPVPEPVSAGLLLLGGMVLLRRRR